MIGEPPEDDRSILDPHPDEEENEAIPAGYTYLGQFIDHDITFDPVTSFERSNDPESRHNFRTPRFDLDSLYGRGPDDQPYLYTRDGIRFLLGRELKNDAAAGRDLPRNSEDQALVGDPRNDENRIVSQVHCLILRLHNALADRVTAAHPAQSARETFLEAQRLTRWHYQWIVLNDFLPKIVGRPMVDAIVGVESVASSCPGVCGQRFKPKLLFYRPKQGRPYIPVEFSVAAYRFGHSMVRPSYHFNRSIMERMERDRKSKKRNTFRMPIFSAERSDPEADLGGFRGMPPTWAFQWQFFFGPWTPPLDHAGSPRLTQPSYQIDISISDPLILHLNKAGVVHDQPISLAARNLLRGLQLGLPSGQDVARLMGHRPLEEDEIRLSDSEMAELEKRLGSKFSEKEIREILDAPNQVRSETPLWYYVLREAQRRAHGSMLGPVGGRIVAEVLIGILFLDKTAYVNLDPAWHPVFGSADSGQWQASMADLAQFVQHHERNGASQGAAPPS
jgi:hypothetical protein